MKSRIFLTALTAAALACLCAAAADPPTKAGDAAKTDAVNDYQDVVYFGDTRPMLLRLHVQINGKPYLVAWDDFMKHLFQYLDTNGDGMLSKEEAERTPPPQVIFNNNSPFGGAPLPALAALDADRDGKVSPQELSDYYRRSGGAPFQMGGGLQGQNLFPGQAVAVRLGDQGQATSPEALNDAIFALLDTNKDGRLSREELAAATEAFLKLDLDDNEVVTSQELLPNSQPANTGGFVVASPAMPAQQPTNKSFAMVNPGEPATNLVRELLRRYGPKGGQPARKLSAKDIGLDDESFKQLDVDGDGELDSEELARFTRRPPDVELQVRLGKTRSTQDAVDLVERSAAAGDRPSALATNLKKVDGGVALDLGNVRVDFRASGDLPKAQYDQRIREFYKAQFKSADRDNNGYLDATEAMTSPIFRTLFKVMDKDGDGNLYEKEMRDYLDDLQDLQNRAISGCVSLGVSEAGKGLFDLLDTNRDGRLSLREMRNAPKLLDELDRDHEGYISRGKIPRTYQLTVRQGPSAAPDPQGPRVVAIRGDPMTQPLPQAPAGGPLWFRKMDRNRDGDVSRREWLGSAEEFRRIDADGDGLISRDEAEKADEQLRKDAPR